jgi:preprotein translocase subunit SecG
MELIMAWLAVVFIVAVLVFRLVRSARGPGQVLHSRPVGMLQLEPLKARGAVTRAALKAANHH